MNQIAYLNKNFSDSLQGILDVACPECVFLVTGKKSFESSGAKGICDTVLKNTQVTIFDEFDTNPKIEDIEKGVVVFKEVNPDLVLAIGGGSVIDIAKSINVLSVENGDCLKDYVVGKKKLTSSGAPLVAVPTTSGSGSEATHFAVVYIKEKKYSLAHESMLPEYSIIDAQLTMSLPVNITAAAGLDALAQGIESYWSINATDESKKYARQAITLAIQNLERAVHAPDEASRRAMSEAAYYAGKAINISKTTAAHALSYSLTAHFGVAHGHAVFLALPQVFKFNSEVVSSDVVDERGVDYVKETMHELVALLGCTSVPEARELLESLVTKLNLPIKLREFGVVEKDIVVFLEGVSPERMGNNPRKCTTEIAESIYMGIL